MFGWMIKDNTAESRSGGLTNVMLATGLGLLLNVSLIYITACLYLALGGRIGSVSSVLILLVSLGGALWAARRFTETRTEQIHAIAAIVAIWVVSILVSGLVIDTSIDGQFYHFMAVEVLAHGWNPFYEPAPLLPDTEGIKPAIWVSHYPVASWIVVAVHDAAGLSVESAKGFAIAVFLGSGLLTIAVLRRIGLQLAPAFLIGALAAANPVMLSQLFTRMNDGILAEFLLCIIMLAVVAIQLRDRSAIICLVPLLIFALNLKFSAVPILVAVCGLICLATWLARGRRDAMVTAGILAATGIAGIFLIGFAPYAKNLIGFGHPFYPLMGPNETHDIMRGNTPPFIMEMNPVRAFFYSLFAETHSGFQSQPSLKFPFTLSVSEIRISSGPDVRIAGFGPLFSGAVMLAAGVSAALLYLHGRNRAVLACLGTAASLLVLAIVFPESWWARYVPFLWLVPVSVAAAPFLINGTRLRIAGIALAGALALNSGMVFAAMVYMNVDRHIEAMQQVEALRTSGAAKYEIDFDLALSRSRLLKRAGIDFRNVENISRDDCVTRQEVAAYGPDRQGGLICRLPDGVTGQEKTHKDVQ